MKLVNIGFGNMISAQRLVAIVSPDSAPVKRMIQEGRERGILIDATYGRRTRAVLVMDNDHLVLSALQPETVAEMLASQQGRGGVRIDSPYGLCVNRNDTLLADRLVYGHQGMSGGITANVYFEPESRFVFVMISNGCSNKLQNRVCAISRKLFNLMWEKFGE